MYPVVLFHEHVQHMLIMSSPVSSCHVQGMCSDQTNVFTSVFHVNIKCTTLIMNFLKKSLLVCHQTSSFYLSNAKVRDLFIVASFDANKIDSDML